MKEQRVLIVGSGVAGLTAAAELAGLDKAVTIVEQQPFAGGHAVGFACKATGGKCVKCGACLADGLLEKVVAHPRIQLALGAEVGSLSVNRDRFDATIQQAPAVIDGSACNGCGKCLVVCPEKNAIVHGTSAFHKPFWAVLGDHCLRGKGENCTLCEGACPQHAIRLEAEGQSFQQTFDAVIGATGFSVYSPEDKPYGYGVFKDVITNLELEAILREQGRVICPSDETPPEKMAFIQCVGSRDASRGRLWCSKFCCGSALRTAVLIKERQPETEIHIFYIDIQSFSRNFSVDFTTLKENIRLVRTIPADIYQAEDNRLRVLSANPATGESMEELYDMVVLSAGMGPGKGAKELASMFHVPLEKDGFFPLPAGSGGDEETGIFWAGTACGPMTIAESAASGGRAAWRVLKYLEKKQSDVS